jgi:hypothetical protein
VLKPQELYRSRVQNLKVSEARNPFSIGVRPLSRFLRQRYWSGWRFLVPPFFEDRGPLLSTAFPGGSCRIKSPTPYVMISDVPFAKRECRRRGRGAGYTPRRCVRSRDPCQETARPLGDAALAFGHSTLRERRSIVRPCTTSPQAILVRVGRSVASVDSFALG